MTMMMIAIPLECDGAHAQCNVELIVSQ